MLALIKKNNKEMHSAYVDTSSDQNFCSGDSLKSTSAAHWLLLIVVSGSSPLLPTAQRQQKGIMSRWVASMKIKGRMTFRP